MPAFKSASLPLKTNYLFFTVPCEDLAYSNQSRNPVINSLFLKGITPECHEHSIE
jgi:hypothetical protein